MKLSSDPGSKLPHSTVEDERDENVCMQTACWCTYLKSEIISSKTDIILTCNKGGRRRR